MFNEKVYVSIAIDKLAIFAIARLITDENECSYERLVKECFELFKKRFSLRRYTEWPDSNRVYLSLVRCRNNGWIVGNEKSGFNITNLGIKIAQEVAEQLKNPNVFAALRQKTSHARERGEVFINYMKNSKAYNNYLRDKTNFSITEKEFRELLGVTVETPPRILKQNLIHFINISKEYSEKELLKFLKIIDDQTKHLTK